MELQGSLKEGVRGRFDTNRRYHSRSKMLCSWIRRQRVEAQAKEFRQAAPEAVKGREMDSPLESQ